MYTMPIIIGIFEIAVIAISLFIIYGTITLGYHAFFDDEIPETLPKKRDHLILFCKSPFEYIEILYEQYKSKQI